MAKARSSFICQNCGAVSQRWLGKCEACGDWNSIVEEVAGSGIGAQAARGARKGRVFPLEGLTGQTRSAPRSVSTIAELDRVTGGAGHVVHDCALLADETVEQRRLTDVRAPDDHDLWLTHERTNVVSRIASRVARRS